MLSSLAPPPIPTNKKLKLRMCELGRGIRACLGRSIVAASRFRVESLGFWGGFRWLCTVYGLGILLYSHGSSRNITEYFRHKHPPSKQLNHTQNTENEKNTR